MDAESRVSTFERLNKDLNRQIVEMQENLENESRDKSTMMAKMRWIFVVIPGMSWSRKINDIFDYDEVLSL